MTFPNIEDYYQHRLSLARRDAEPREPLPTTVQEAVDRLVKLITDSYRSGASFIQVKVPFDVSQLTDLPFPMPDRTDWKMINPFFRMARNRLDEYVYELFARSDLDHSLVKGFIGLDQIVHSQYWSISAEIEVKPPSGS